MKYLYGLKIYLLYNIYSYKTTPKINIAHNCKPKYILFAAVLIIQHFFVMGIVMRSEMMFVPKRFRTEITLEGHEFRVYPHVRF